MVGCLTADVTSYEHAQGLPTFISSHTKLSVFELISGGDWQTCAPYMRRLFEVALVDWVSSSTHDLISPFRAAVINRWSCLAQALKK
jgi:hypothetical protein